MYRCACNNTVLWRCVVLCCGLNMLVDRIFSIIMNGEKINAEGWTNRTRDFISDWFDFSCASNLSHDSKRRQNDWSWSWDDSRLANTVFLSHISRENPSPSMTQKFGLDQSIPNVKTKQTPQTSSQNEGQSTTRGAAESYSICCRFAPTTQRRIGSGSRMLPGCRATRSHCQVCPLQTQVC